MEGFIFCGDECFGRPLAVTLVSQTILRQMIQECIMSFRLRLTLVLVATLFGFTEARAQGPMAGHDMGEMKPVDSPDKLPVPERMTGIGNGHITITATPEAQAWFDQGLNLSHDFWDYESARAFEQAIRVDPNCAMCYWGLARALGFRGGADQYAKEALDQAAKLKGHTKKAEKLYIEAAVAAEEDDKKQPDAAGSAEKKKKTESSTDIYRKLVKDNRSDLQAKIFLAESVNEGYDDKGEPRAGTKETIAILEEVLKTAPNDSAANHYWIHAMEPSLHPERALKSAALLASLAPSFGAHGSYAGAHLFPCG